MRKSAKTARGQTHKKSTTTNLNKALGLHPKDKLSHFLKNAVKSMKKREMSKNSKTSKSQSRIEKLTDDTKVSNSYNFKKFDWSY